MWAFCRVTRRRGLRSTATSDRLPNQRYARRSYLRSATAALRAVGAGRLALGGAGRLALDGEPLRLRGRRARQALGRVRDGALGADAVHEALRVAVVAAQHARHVGDLADAALHHPFQDLDAAAPLGLDLLLLEVARLHDLLEDVGLAEVLVVVSGGVPFEQ